MPTEAHKETAAARLRAAGLPEALADTLASRVAGVLEQLHQQATALPAAVEPAITFGAGACSAQPSARRRGERRER
jgi:hypothetical protein